MEDSLSKLEAKLNAVLDLLQCEYAERKMLRNQERWLDASTTKFMIGKQDKSLYNYVQKGAIIAKKLGGVNVYLESSVLKFLERSRPSTL